MMVDDAQKKMLVRTRLAVSSGKGTAMHSKTGQSTISQYIIFKDKPDQSALDRKKEDI